MKIFEHHLRNASELISQYKGTIPFSAWIKNYFKEHKKFGSKDRKQISHLCFCYFRLGKALAKVGVDEKILAGLFLTSNSSNDFLHYFKPNWKEQTILSLEEKLHFIANEFHLSEKNIIDEIFSWQDELCASIDPPAFSTSHLIQPDVFLRVRPGNETKVASKLNAAEITFNTIGQNTLSVSSAVKIDDVIELNKEAVIQDLSSQIVASFFGEINVAKKVVNVWDCCAASGGKSIMFYDFNKNINLTVSDIRNSILANLHERFKEAGITKYQSFTIDLSNPQAKLPAKNFDLIIADVPCSGSGTWGRTPEQLSFFPTEKIDHYSRLQTNITANVVEALADSGYFLYITCSVFKKENEEAVKHLEEKGLKLIRKQTLSGYDKKADTMFAALLRKV
ncbi:Fmu (Sun) domain-containing protein [Pinibacter soli]|uniref:Fmu (Sun) domain-containing protein n=1 Tax=Pinibacter soli TaxID=3044211 RepID=A0ABT6RH63_9BACT|nr:Fmu (Sun) domain-containing protein [Pinibacter soli]MDI3321905.1 Fmu (Sun) domain-containing protein [Pinibacter soli]